MCTKFDIPGKVVDLIKTIKKRGKKAYLVGGCVRDWLLYNTPKDYDICTNALPNDIVSYFDKVVPTGIQYGTVTVVVNNECYEITTARKDGSYSDGRRPDVVEFTTDIEEDLSRRDFTINAMAYDPVDNILIDPLDGRQDLENGVIRAVGIPVHRFEEDGLRVMRAIRFASRYGFKIDSDTFEAMKKCSHMLKNVSAERIRDELMKILSAKHSDTGIGLLRDSGAFEHFLPEIINTYDCGQNKYHALDVFGHLQHAVQHAPINKPLVRLAALLHDIGKPSVKALNKRGEYSFIQHEKYSAAIADDFMKRMKFSNEEREHVVRLVRHHMDLFGSSFKDKAVRKFIYRLGKKNLEDLFALRRADMSAKTLKGIKDEDLMTLNNLISKCNSQLDNMIHSPKDLAVDGEEIMDRLGTKPGPLIGQVIERLVKYVLVVPGDNNREKLLKLIPGFYKDVKNGIGTNNGKGKKRRQKRA